MAIESSDGQDLNNPAAGETTSPPIDAAPYDWRTDIHPDVKSDKLWESVPDVKSLTKGYADAVKYNVGALKLPGADAPAEEWNRVWDKLGRPAGPDGYVIPETINIPALVALRETAHATGMTAKQWDGLMQNYERTVEAELTTRNQAAAVTTTALKEQWGGAYEKKIGLIQKMIRVHGGDEVFDEYNRSGGGNHLPTIKMFAVLAEALADEGFIENSVQGVMSKEDAMNEIATLTASPEYANPRHPAHKQAVERATKLFELAYN